ncbi:hypothetical protein MLD52_19575 [Puniceicoccaceae bacterium K14]|nr:hypothetical protein [Puniceicoccaceae bacterium K14]
MKKQNSAVSGLEVLTLEQASQLGDLPLINCETIQSKLHEALKRLMQENWLPHGLRSLLVEELLSVKDELSADQPDVSNIAKRVHSIALTTFSYPKTILNSKTVTIVRVLDLEMTPFATLRQTESFSLLAKKQAS